jgi:hypothetical protein
MQAIIYIGNIYNSNLMDKLRGVWGISQVGKNNKKILAKLKKGPIDLLKKP